MTRSKRRSCVSEAEKQAFIEAATQFNKLVGRMQADLKIGGEQYEALADAHRATRHAIAIMNGEWLSWARPRSKD